MIASLVFPDDRDDVVLHVECVPRVGDDVAEHFNTPQWVVSSVTWRVFPKEDAPHHATARPIVFLEERGG